MTSQKYRADIDGLRSLAIVPVLFYHAGLPAFSGGFIGVDVFFVISGYLITSILIRDFEARTYRVFDFYERRIRRILPALLIVLAFVLAASPFVLLPSEFEPLGRDVAASLLFVANINFWLQSGYFSVASEAKPLLHMWSLGVEEQFYLFAPIAVFAILRYAPRFKLHIVATGMLCSLAACVYYTKYSPSAAFYLLPTRAWELMAGVALAMHLHNREAFRRTSHVQDAFGVAGLALIVIPIFTFSKATAFPGYAAAAPVAGAVLTILAGPHSKVGTLLSTRPMVMIGLISYSLYLWHWPLIVVFRNIGALESYSGKAAVVAASCIAAWLTWRFVERPTRDRLLFPFPKLTALLGIACVSILGVSACFSVLGGWPARVTEAEATFDNARNDVSPDRQRCHFDSGSPSPSSACLLGPADGIQVALWGDSHGVELAKALSERGLTVAQMTYSSCPPSSSGGGSGSRRFCSDWNKRVFKHIQSTQSLHTVILTAYFDQTAEGLTGRELELASTARDLQRAGKNVIVVGPFPMIGPSVDLPTFLARGGNPVQRVDLRNTVAFRAAMSGAGTLYEPSRIFCEGAVCNFAPGGHPILFDAHHPSLYAARTVADGLLPYIESANDRRSH